VTSGGYGYATACSIAYAYLPAEVTIGTEVAIDIFGQWVSGVVSAEPLLDPDGQRMRASE
jgi:glycine cleavage system aminomethyltransferase T